MNLHEYKDDFRQLCTLAAAYKHIPESAVRRDYHIVMMLKNLAESEYAQSCVFKGGTSLSKCYPGSIERFSEDIDLTFLGMELSDKECDRSIKHIEDVMTVGMQTFKIGSERSNRSKSMFVWLDDENDKIKLEIGSTVRPDPYFPRSIKTYIQEFLENNCHEDEVLKYGLHEVTLNVLGIERTFIDKIMSVKRHALCGTLRSKVRHIYDVTRLYDMPEIQDFIANTDELLRLMQQTKETDSFYLRRRNISLDYNPMGVYGFDEWKDCFDEQVRANYERLHEDLLYTDEKQSLDKAILTFTEINRIMKEIGE